MFGHTPEDHFAYPAMGIRAHNQEIGPGTSRRIDDSAGPGLDRDPLGLDAMAAEIADNTLLVDTATVVGRNDRDLIGAGQKGRRRGDGLRGLKATVPGDGNITAGLVAGALAGITSTGRPVPIRAASAVTRAITSLELRARRTTIKSANRPRVSTVRSLRLLASL
jgi:hypothetical protein